MVCLGRTVRTESFGQSEFEMALTTLISVKTQSGISAADTSRDSQIRCLIDGVTSLVKQHLNRDLELQEYSEFYSGDGSPFLLLRQYPVVAVSSVCVDDAGYFGANPDGFDRTLELVEGNDFALMSGMGGTGSTGLLRRIGATWRRMPSRAIGVVENLPGLPNGNIRVQYSAGFAPIPLAIVMAVNSLVMRQLQQTSIGGVVQSMTYEDAAVSFINPADATKVLSSIESTLGNYKSISI